jgi:phenylalanyl-tRNA synthetase beta chain
MKISLNWLNEWIDLTEEKKHPQILGDLLTKAGLEVESIEDRAKSFDHVVVGMLLEVGKHPSADRLTLCQVVTGEGVVHQIVCGAKNHKANDRIVVALPGAKLPNGLEIKVSQIRGVESRGMLCSESELGLKNESDGILILPSDAPVGKPLAEYMGWSDVIFELKVTPNRADCLSHLGIARELSSWLGRPLKSKSFHPDKFSKNSSPVMVVVNDKTAAPRYSGRVLENVNVGPSPAWVAKRLESLGFKSINNVVDATNFAMIELGQPMHAFDFAKINGQKIVVERAGEAQTFETLDGTKLNLKGNELCIKDGSGIVALAGVIGGRNSGVSDSTTKVFLESACFLAAETRKTQRAHGIHTESGYRFSRGVDPLLSMNALDLATKYLMDWAAAIPQKEVIDVRGSEWVAKSIEISLIQITQALGYEAQKENFEKYMRALGCQVHALGGDKFQISPPAYRYDLENLMDIVEEYARLDGYEKIPEIIPPMRVAPLLRDEKIIFKEKMARVVRALGFSRSINMVFGNSGSEDNSFGLSMGTPVAILNPLNKENSLLRQDLAGGLLENVKYNVRHGQNYGALFEIGKVFGRSDGIQESWRLALVQWGHPPSAYKTDLGPVHAVAAAIGNLAESLSLNFQLLPGVKSQEFVHPHQSEVVQFRGKKIGYYGALHPVPALKLKIDVAIAELSLDSILDAIVNSKSNVKFVPYSSYPYVDRDFSLLLPESLTYRDVERELNKIHSETFVSSWVFDQYSGDKIPQGKKSLGVGVRFQKKTGTFSDDEIQILMQKTVDGLKKLSVELRQ